MVRPRPWWISKRSYRGVNLLLSLRSPATSTLSTTWHGTTFGLVDCFVTGWHWFAEVLPILRNPKSCSPSLESPRTSSGLFDIVVTGTLVPPEARLRMDRAYEVSYRQLWEDELKWMIQPRCKICPDAIGEAADIVASDMWSGGGPTGEDEEFNGIIVRTHRGRELFEAASTAGAIILDGKIGFRDLDLVQPHQLRKKRAVWARFAGMQAAGLPVPQTSRLRITSCARLKSLEENLNEARSARDRAKQGRLGEPKPRPR